MFDLNAIVSAALNAAVQQAVAPLVEQIAKLEAQSADQHQRLRVLEGALTDRVVALEGDISHRAQVQQANITAALAERIAALETKLTEANLFTQMVPATPTTDITRHIIDALSDTDHPLFKRLSSFMDAVAEQAMDNHCETYDHDSYDEMASKVDDLPDNLDDYATRDEVRSEIEDVLNNATLSLSI